jgi:hypothetical protein
MRGGIILNKFYLNGNVTDKYRNIFTGNAAITALNKKFNASKNKDYFKKYEEILRKSLWKKNNVLFSMSEFKIFNPFDYYAYPSNEYDPGYCMHGKERSDWDWTDFLKLDIWELFNNYNYMVLLPGWWKCKEAWLKYIIAKFVGIKIYTFRKLIKEL